jgi:lipid-A-disaccharide synthase
MAKVVDHVLALLPFEPPYMRAAGMTCDFVGHPVAAEPRATLGEASALRAGLGIAPGRPALVLLPGSRHGEVTRLGPVFAATARQLLAERPELAVLVPAAAPVVRLVRDHLGDVGTLLDPTGLPQAEAEARKRAAFAAADAALAASGTVSLELAAQGTPMVIAYDAAWLTAQIARRMIRVDTPTLVNLVTESRVVPDFLFENCTADKIAPAVARLLDDPAAAAAQRAIGARAMALLGRGGEPPGLRAARSVLAQIGQLPVATPGDG